MTDRTPQDPAADLVPPVTSPRREEPAGATRPGAAGRAVPAAPAGTAPSTSPAPAPQLPGAGDPDPAGSRTRTGLGPAGATFSTEPAEGARGGDPEPGRGGQGPPRPGRGARPALRGAEWRKEAAKAARRRPAKAAPRAAAKAPAIPPPPVVGASLTSTAQCLSGCGVIAGPGDLAEVDRAAAKHTKGGHATNLFSEPVAGAA